MKLIIRAGGAMRTGPERNMVDDYRDRAQAMARGLGFLSIEEQSVDLSKCRNRQEETERLLSGLPTGGTLFILDERGKSLRSRDLATTLARLRDDGSPAATFLIGGADGFEPSALPGSVRKISFGAQTWPHKLVRVMLAEQIYRALSILAGTPYHRD